MRRAALFLFVMALPLMASGGAPEHEGKYWRNCTVDADCIAIDGVCGLTAVNAAFKDEAIAYYREKMKLVRCVQRFWKPEDRVARCRLEQCETIPRQPAQ